MEDNQNITPRQNIHFCPSCKSENIQKLSLTYMSGASKTKGVGIGAGMGGGVGLGVGLASNQTLLSTMVAPPQISSPLWGALGVWVGIFMIGSIIVMGLFPDSLINFVLMIALLIASFWSASKVYHRIAVSNKAKTEEYGKKYICLRCSNIFELAQ
jgi:hypothetical protein